MKFLEVLPSLIEGHKARIKSWSMEYYIQLKGKNLMIHGRREQVPYPYDGQRELSSNDWEVTEVKLPQKVSSLVIGDRFTCLNDDETVRRLIRVDGQIRVLDESSNQVYDIHPEVLVYKAKNKG